MKQKLFSLLTLLLCVCGGAWGETGTEVIAQDNWSSGKEYSGTCVTGAGTYSSGNGGKNIEGYSPSNKGVKLNAKSTNVTISSTKYGYVILNVKDGYKVTSLKLEGTSNGSNSIMLVGVYIDVDTEILATSLESATNLYSVGKTFPSKTTTYVSSDAVSMAAEQNIVLLFDNSSDSQMRAIFTLEWEKTPTLTGAWKISGDDVTGETANVVQNADAPTMPTFTVGATSGTPTVSDYNVSYDVTGTSGIFTMVDGEPTGISTATSGTATVTATLTTNSASYLTPATNTFTYTVKVSAATAPTITTQPTSGTATVGEEHTLNVVATGVPSDFTYQWYECEDAEKTNAEMIDAATSDSYTFTPGAVGTRYFYVVVSNGVSPDATSDVATITSALPVVANPTFTVYGNNSVRINCATDGARIYYTTDDSDPTTSDTRIAYTSANTNLIGLTGSGTIKACAEKDNATTSAVVSQAVTVPTVGSTSGSLMMVIQPNGVPPTDTQYDSNTYMNAGYTLATGEYLANTTLFTNYSTIMFKIKKGNYTITPPADVTIQSVKIIGFSNNDAKTMTISAGDGYTLVSSTGVMVPRYTYYAGTTTGVESEVVITKNTPAEGEAFTFIVGGETGQGRICVEVYGTTSASKETITPAYTYTTYMPTHNLDFSSTNKLTAYIATSANASNVTLTSIDKVPAGTPVVLKATETGSPIDVSIASTTDDVTSNLLKGGDGKTQIGGDAKYDYILKDSEFHKVTTASALAAGKAYLHLTDAPAAGARLNFIFEDEIVTDINTIKNEEANVKDIFNLNGQRVAQPRKGLFVVRSAEGRIKGKNGKKVFIK